MVSMLFLVICMASSRCTFTLHLTAAATSQADRSPAPNRSYAGNYHGGFPQPFHVAHRRCAEEPLVLPVEVRSVRVAHAVAGACGIEILTEHETAGLLEPHLLLELQGTHRGERLEVVVESRDAHPELSRHVLDPQRPVEVFAQPLEGPGDEVSVAT